MSRTSFHELTVGFLIDRWEPARGGAERALADLARHLITRGARVLAFAERASADAPGEFVRVRTWGMRGPGRERRRAERLVAAAELARCEVTIGIRHLSRVDLYWPHGGALEPALRAREIARGRDPKRAVRGRFRGFLEFERELLAGGARRVVCVSKLVEDEFRRAYPDAAPRLCRVDNGVDLARFRIENRATLGAALRRELEVGDDEPLIAFAAREPELKGLATLLDALAELRDRPWCLVAAGAKHFVPWRRRAFVRGLRERIVWHRDVDPVALWSAADLCAAPTFRDTSGLVILEALASGTPVVTTTAAGAAEAIVEDAQGRVVAPGDPAALANALRELLDRRTLDRERVRAAVLERGLDSKLDELAAIVLDLARA
ncbi:MAG: glycosyltransferase family 4 protein [Planctomycetes bacterium]|nr:glycosyltransferase family 4 protein [Planctomycetota bacterium]